MKTKRVKVLLVTAILALSTIFVGCGKSSSTLANQDVKTEEETIKGVTETADVSEVSANKTTETSELEKLTLQSLWLPQGQFAGYYVAKEKGFYEEEGIDLEILPGGTDVTSEDQVENDVAQVGITFYSSLLTYQEGGYDLVNVSQVLQASPQWLITKADSGITTGADLIGKKVGSWFGGRQYEFYALAQKYGYSIDDIEWVQQDYTMDQFYSDSIDAASAMSYNEYPLVLKEGYSESDFHIIDMNKEGVAMLEDCLFVKRSWAESNSDLLIRFLRASIKGWKYANENPEEAGQIVFDAGESATLEHQIAMTKKVIEYIIPTDSDASQIGVLDRKKIQQTIDLGVQSGLIKEAINIQDSIDSTYWEAAVAGLNE